MSKTIIAAVARWRSAPFTRVTTVIDDRSLGAAWSGPNGQKVSNPFARVH
jgi:hypothetical protein